MAGEVRLEGLL